MIDNNLYSNIPAQVTFKHECTDATIALKTVSPPATSFTHYLLIDPALTITLANYFDVLNAPSSVTCYTFSAYETSPFALLTTYPAYLTQNVAAGTLTVHGTT